MTTFAQPHPGDHPPLLAPVSAPSAHASAPHLRPYQRDAIAAVRQDWRRGYHDVLLVLATGGGKTHCFLSLAAEELTDRPNGRVLIVAHRQELITQPLDRLREFWPHLTDRAGVVMNVRDDCDRQIIIATVQSLTAHRLDRILTHGPIDVLVTDEAHHAVAETYVRIIERLRSANPRLRHLGVTATPARTDKRGLAQVYQRVSYKAGIAELVPQGWLVPPRWLYRIDVPRGPGVVSQIRVLGGGHDFEALSTQAQHYAEQFSDTLISNKDAAWRHRPATDPQRDFIRKLARRTGSRGVPSDLGTLPRGEAGRLISFLLAKQALKAAGRWHGAQIDAAERDRFDDRALAQALAAPKMAQPFATSIDDLSSTIGGRA